MAIFSARAVFEALRCYGLQKNIGISIPLYVACVMPIVAFFLDSGDFFRIIFTSTAFLLFIVMAITALQNPRPEFKTVASALLLSVFAILGFSVIEILGTSEHGSFLLFFVYVASWVTDGGALFIGKLFGKHKLCPALSPNKTVEGFLGGLFVGSVVLVVMVALVDVFVETVSPNYIMVAITAIVTTVVSQAGDLSFSAIKRDAQIKDFSRLLPGHGGVLDRFDSTFAVSFALLFLLNFHRLF
jgi:phosphatidate cytidylyltransferase